MNFVPDQSIGLIELTRIFLGLGIAAKPVIYSQGYFFEALSVKLRFRRSMYKKGSRGRKSSISIIKQCVSSSRVR